MIISRLHSEIFYAVVVIVVLLMTTVYAKICFIGSISSDDEAIKWCQYRVVMVFLFLIAFIDFDRIH